MSVSALFRYLVALCAQVAMCSGTVQAPSFYYDISLQCHLRSTKNSYFFQILYISREFHAYAVLLSSFPQKIKRRIHVQTNQRLLLHQPTLQSLLLFTILYSLTLRTQRKANISDFPPLFDVLALNCLTLSCSLAFLRLRSP